MRNPKNYHILFILMLVIWNVPSSAQTSNSWSKEKANKWFKAQEWWNNKSVHEAERQYDLFGREIFDDQSDSMTTANTEFLPFKPHKSINKEEFAKQYHLNKPWWSKALAFLKETDLIAIKPGKYFIDGDNVVATVTEGFPRRIDTTQWESHRDYADIHYVISGKEQIGVESVSSLNIADDYDAIRDLIFYSGKGKYYIGEPGSFFVFFPEDAHRPNLQFKRHSVKKIVIKVRIS